MKFLGMILGLDIQTIEFHNCFWARPSLTWPTTSLFDVNVYSVIFDPTIMALLKHIIFPNCIFCKYEDTMCPWF